MSDPPPPAPPGAPGTSPSIQNMFMKVSQQTPEECSPGAGAFEDRTKALNSVTPKVPPKSFFQSKRKLDLLSSSSPTPPQPQPKKVKKGPRSKEQAPQSGKSRTGWSIVLLKSEGKIQIKPWFSHLWERKACLHPLVLILLKDLPGTLFWIVNSRRT